MVEHAWCHDIDRDAAVRAAEDGRTGPLPTLGECIDGMIPKSDSATSGVEQENKGESMATKSEIQAADFRAEASEQPAPEATRNYRVSLECVHRFAKPPSQWDWWKLVELRPGESVRVVEEDREAADRVSREEGYRVLIAEVIAARDERDAAIREREELRGEITSVLDRAEQVRSEHDALRARVAELEAASGGGDGEPDYYVYKNELGMIVYTSQKLVNDGWGGCTIEPVYKEPSQPRGCLTQHEIAALTGCCVSSGNLNEEGKKTIRNLLARSSPPDVVLPPMVIAYDDRWRGCEGGGK